MKPRDVLKVPNKPILGTQVGGSIEALPLGFTPVIPTGNHFKKNNGRVSQRKRTPGRRVQYAQVKKVIRMSFGDVEIRTRSYRRIMHQPIPTATPLGGV